MTPEQRAEAEAILAAPDTVVNGSRRRPPDRGETRKRRPITAAAPNLELSDTESNDLDSSGALELMPLPGATEIDGWPETSPDDGQRHSTWPELARLSPRLELPVRTFCGLLRVAPPWPPTPEAAAERNAKPMCAMCADLRAFHRAEGRWSQ